MDFQQIFISNLLDDKGREKISIDHRRKSMKAPNVTSKTIFVLELRFTHDSHVQLSYSKFTSHNHAQNEFGV